MSYGKPDNASVESKLFKLLNIYCHFQLGIFGDQTWHIIWKTILRNLFWSSNFCRQIVLQRQQKNQKNAGPSRGGYVTAGISASICEQNNLKSSKRVFMKKRNRWLNVGDILDSEGTLTFDLSRTTGQEQKPRGHWEQSTMLFKDSGVLIVTVQRNYFSAALGCIHTVVQYVMLGNVKLYNLTTNHYCHHILQV